MNCPAHPGAVGNPHVGSADPDDPRELRRIAERRRRRRRGAPARPARVRGRAGTGTGVDHEEHADRCRHGVGPRCRDARARSARRLAPRRHRVGGGARRQRGRPGSALGGRPDRRHRQLPLRTALVRGLGGRGARRAVARGRRRRARLRSGVERRAGAGGDLRRGARCSVSGATDVALSLALHRLLLPRGAAGPAGRDDRRAAPARARRAAHRLGGARPVRGGGGLGRRLPGARLQLVGLGGGRAGRQPRRARWCARRPAAGRVPPEDGLGADALYAATPAIADELCALAAEHGAGARRRCRA